METREKQKSLSLKFSLQNIHTQVYGMEQQKGV